MRREPDQRTLERLHFPAGGRRYRLILEDAQPAAEKASAAAAMMTSLLFIPRSFPMARPSRNRTALGMSSRPASRSQPRLKAAPACCN
jgi:hypothetical protein